MPSIDEEGGSGREDRWAVVVARREGNGDGMLGLSVVEVGSVSTVDVNSGTRRTSSFGYCLGSASVGVLVCVCCSDAVIVPALMPGQDHAPPTNQLLEPAASSVPPESSPETATCDVAPASTAEQQVALLGQRI